VRNIIDSPEYQNIFPNVSLRADMKRRGDWATNHSGEFYAIGVGGVRGPTRSRRAAG
jgi:hypothetical protein